MSEGRLPPLPEDWDRALAIVAHPDDLEYGAASAVARWSARGKWVGYALRRDIARMIRRHRPEVLVLGNFGLRWGVSGPLNMADHRVVGIAALDAARDAGNRWIFPELLDEGLDPWSGVRFAAVSATSDPSHAVDVTATIDRGVASLREHRVYLAGLESAPDPDAFLREHATVAGARAGCRYAVDFEMVVL